MQATAQRAEYLDEVRQQVCSLCPDEGPWCWHCGVELRLPELIDAIHHGDQELPELGPPAEGQMSCVGYHCCPGSTGPCPVASLAARLVEVVKAADERHAQRDAVRRWLSRQPRLERNPAADIIRIYEQATGTWVCCD
jgi:hypothetical protein